MRERLQKHKARNVMPIATTKAVPSLINEDHGRRGIANKLLHAISFAGAAVSCAGLANPAIAQMTAAQTEEAKVDSTIAELEAVIAKATGTLIELKNEKARRAGEQSNDTHDNAVPPLGTSNYQQKTKLAALTRLRDMPACDAPGSDGSIGSYMLQLKGPDNHAKEAALEEYKAATYKGINDFVYNCLGLKRASDYKNTTDLSFQFVASKGDDQIEAVITHTTRVLKPNDDKSSFAAVYKKYSLGGFGTESDSSALLIDLTESNFASGVGIAGGFEWGRMPAKSAKKLKDSIHAGIAKARQDCFAANRIVDPLTHEGAKNADRPSIAPNPLAACEGDTLQQWMSDSERSNKYWSDIVAPLWGYNAKPEIFAGVQFRAAFQDLTYRPVIDPKTTTVIVTTLPDEVKIHPKTYSIKAYGGFSRPLKFGNDKKGDIGLTASLTHRREVDFIASTADQIVCTPAAPSATFDTCKSKQKLAAPYDTEGFIGGVALNFQADRFWYLPSVAISPRLTYAFDTKRLGIEIPLFLLTDSDGKLNSGIKYTCRSRGETSEGLELKKSCGVNLFVGTSFDIGKGP